MTGSSCGYYILNWSINNCYHRATLIFQSYVSLAVFLHAVFAKKIIFIYLIIINYAFGILFEAFANVDIWLIFDNLLHT